MALGIDPTTADTRASWSWDCDGDGVSLLDEYRHGTDPWSDDSNWDGIPDSDEIGAIIELWDAPLFALTNEVDITAHFANCTNAFITLDLPGGMEINGVQYTNICVGIDGIAFLNTAESSVPALNFYNENRDLAIWQLKPDSILLAPYWDDLCATTNAPLRPSAVILAEAFDAVGNAEYDVIEWRDMRPADAPDSAELRATFRIIIPRADTDRVYFQYPQLAGGMDGASASVGFQTLNSARRVSWCFNESGAVWQGLHLAAIFGAVAEFPAADFDSDGDGLSDEMERRIGTNPDNRDSDGDGLSDGLELRCGTDPLCADTDGDLMTDGWEAAYGLDPFTPGDITDPDTDWDNDGLSLLDEYRFCTNPWNGV
jgi:hypothetical protein